MWLVLELGCIYLSLTLMSINTSLCKWDVLSFSSYKVGIVIKNLFLSEINSKCIHFLV